MSAPRLTFLYPHLFKPFRSIEPTTAGIPAKAPQHAPRRSFQISNRRQQTLSQRYGNATDPQLPPPSINEGRKPLPKEALKSENRDSQKEPPPKNPFNATQTPTSEARPDSQKDSLDTRYRNIDLNSQDPDPLGPQPTQPSPDGPPKEGVSKPLETVLHMDPPSTTTVERHKPPHIEAPPYVHHFDTYTLVRNLEKGGFTEDQSVTAMKAVRGLLALNLDVAKEGMVSKSDVENVRFSPPSIHPKSQRP